MGEKFVEWSDNRDPRISCGNQENPNGFVVEKDIGGRGAPTSAVKDRYAHRERPNELVYQ